MRKKSSIISFGYRLRKSSILLYPLIVFLVLDNLLYAFRFSSPTTSYSGAASNHILNSQVLSSNVGIALFVAITFGSYLVGLYFISGHLKRITTELTTRLPLFNILYKMLLISQYSCAAILFFMILQLLLTSSYYKSLLMIIILINFLFASVILGILCYKFIVWYRLNKYRTVILYGSAFAMIAVGTSFAATINGIVVVTPHQPQEIMPKKTIMQTQGLLLLGSKNVQISKSSTAGGTNTNIVTDKNTRSPDLILLSATYFPIRIAYIMMWIATMLLLRNYSRTMGRLKFWIITSLPLACYLSGNIYSDYVGLTNQTQKTNLLYNTLIIVSSVIAGGILFGSAFLTVANSVAHISNVSAVRNYLITSAYGIVLLAISLTSPIVYMPYPPFAATAWSFVALASYLFSLGFFSSAISVSHDSKLRNLLKRSVIENQARFLESIGKAEMQKELEDAVLDLTKKESVKMMEQTGIQSSLSGEDLQVYLGQVLDEINIARKEQK